MRDFGALGDNVGLGHEVTKIKGLKALAADSSGIKVTRANLWRFLKWSHATLKRSSKLFLSASYIFLSPCPPEL